MTMQENKLLNSLRLNYIVALIATAIVVIAFEGGYLHKGALTILLPENYVYMLQVTGVLTTIGLIPLALKWFTHAMEKTRGKSKVDIMNKYSKMSLMRIALLFVVIVLNAFIYYGINYDGAMYCMVFGYGALIYSYPTKNTLEEFIGNKEA